MESPKPYISILDTRTAPLKVLLVDDEPSTLQLVRKILQADGHEIYEAADGEEAIKTFERVRPDLTLLDVVIPKMDGLAVLQKIRKQDNICGVIMVSALSSEQLAVKSMLAGADDYVSKPFKLRTIRLNIRRVMDKVQLRRHNNILQQELIEKNAQLHDILNLYMSPTLAKKLLASPTMPKLGGERQQATILFMDFCNFSAFSHNLEPDIVVRILNEYLALVTTTIMENGGYLDKIMGDGFMAIFNAEEEAEQTSSIPSDHPTRAVYSAIQMHNRVARWNEKQESPLNMRVGIHTGEAVVGNIGTSEMMNYTAIGDAVNLAKRLEEVGEPGQILISENTYKLLDLDEFAVASTTIECVRSQLLKGQETAINIYSVTTSNQIP